MADNLKQKAISGARWGFIENLSYMSVTFIVAFVLQRWFLTSHEFGLIGHLAIFIAVSISFIDSGFSSAIIKKQNPTPEDLKTVFTTNLIISVVCYTLLFILAVPIAKFFRHQELVSLLRVLSIVLILNAFSIVQRALLVKELNFKKLTICSFFSSLLSGVIGIYMAFVGYGVWALVGQQISKQFFNSLLLWILGDWKVSLGFYISNFKTKKRG